MRRALCVFSALPFLFLACSAPFPTGDIHSIVADKSARYLADASSGYSVYGGYASACAHPGAHATFSAGTYDIYAVLDGVVVRVTPCATAGQHDKYDIMIAVGMKGAVPVYFEYSIEPFGGSRCGSSDFSSQIRVEKGQKVAKGDVIARFEAVGSGAHIHYNLKADGAVVCPEIFPASVFVSQTGAISGCAGAAANTLCHELTESEDPSRL